MLVQPLTYTLRTECPVKWTATQEKTIQRDYPLNDIDNSIHAFARKNYLQFLWLPESIMPLRCLVTSLRRITSQPNLSSCPNSHQHPLHDALKPMLLTPRSSSHKYQTIVPAMIEEEHSEDPEAILMWYTYKHEKYDVDENATEQEQLSAEEKWKLSWLERMERREVLIQILLLFLLLSVTPFGPDQETQPVLPSQTSPRSPRKLGRSNVEPEQMLSYWVLEERLESFMDKLSMWQLTSTLDEVIGPGKKSTQRPVTYVNGKQRVVDERDWMQRFCEDVVEPLFRSILPSHCDLLRSKVFPSSPFSDDADSDDTEPSSPKPSNKRLKTSDSSSSRNSPVAVDVQTQSRLLERSRSLSVSLEEERERERSRSLSIGPGNIRKRALVREVSMTTGFKGKSKPLPATNKTRNKRTNSVANSSSLANEKKKRVEGRTLVAATPVKPHKAESDSRSSTSSNRAGMLPKLPALNTSESYGKMGCSIEGDDDDDDWTMGSSPDILLLGTNGWDEEDEEVGNLSDPSAHKLLVAATPTKKSRS